MQFREDQNITPTASGNPAVDGHTLTNEQQLLLEKQNDEEFARQTQNNAQPILRNNNFLSPKNDSFMAQNQFMPRPPSPSQRPPSPYNVKAKIEEEKPTEHKLHQRMSTVHARRKKAANKEEEYTCWDACCHTSVGQHECCATSDDRCDTDQFGIGIVLYFRFLKLFVCYYIIFFVLSAPQMIYSLRSVDQYEKLDGGDFQQWLMGTTIGGVGLGVKLCNLDNYTTNGASINFDCQTGKIDFNKSFQMGVVAKGMASQLNCEYLTINDIAQSCTSTQIADYAKACEGQSSCDFDVQYEDLNEDCKTNATLYPFYTQVYCTDSYVRIGVFDIDRQGVPNFFAATDALIIILFLLMLFTLGRAEMDYVAKAQQKAPQIQYFTLQLSNLPSKELSEDELKTLIYNHVLDFCRYYIEVTNLKTINKEEFGIFDIKISESQEELILTSKKKQLEKQISDRVIGYLKKFDQMQLSDEGEVTIDILTQNLPSIQNVKKQAQASKEIISITKLDAKMKEYNVKIEQMNLKPQVPIKYIWITFKSQSQAKLAEQALQFSPLEHFMLFCCCEPYLPESAKKLVYLFVIIRARNPKNDQKVFLEVQPAPNPESIIWENVNYTDTERFFRQLLTFLLTLIFLLLSFYLIVYIRNIKDQTLAKHPSVDCSRPNFKNIKQEQVIKEYNGDIKNVGYTECYCKPRINEILSNQIPEDVKLICEYWLKDYSLLQVLPIAAVFCILVINVIIQQLFSLFSKFEKHEILSQEYSSRVIKIFFAQFLNTALILLISNISFKLNYSNSVTGSIDFLFGGRYDDMNVQWYQNVGVVLLLTILINVVTTPLMLLTLQLIQFIQQCWDRGCTCDRNKTKCRTAEEQFHLYQGPEFLIDLRYAQILNVSFVCFMYGAGMPILYFFTVVTVTFIFYLDKLWLFIFYRKPQNFDHTLCQRARSALWFVSIVHCGFAIFIYGSQNIFYDSDQSQVADIGGQDQGYFKDWAQRAQATYPNLVILGLLALVAAVLFIAYTCISPFRSIIHNCMRVVLEEKADEFLNRPITQFISIKQLERELKFVQHLKQEKATDEGYKQLLTDKQKYIIEYLNQEKKEHYINMKGNISYDIAYNPIYSECVHWDTILQIPITIDHEQSRASQVQDADANIVDQDSIKVQLSSV